MEKLLVLALCLVAVHAEIKVELDMSTETDVKPGTNVTFMCRVTGLPAGDFVEWYKLIRVLSGPVPEPMSGDPKDSEVQEVYERIATSAVLAPFYKELGNYQATKTTVGEAQLFVINIYNVSDQESGHYGCWVPTDDSAYASVELRVIEPPTKIFFVNHTDAQNMTFVEEQPREVACHVGHSLPTPQVKVSVGHDSEGFRDITEDFTRHTKLNVHCAGAVGTPEKDCPLNMDFDVHMVSMKWEPTFKDEGRNLKCEAFYPDSPDYAHIEPISTEIMIDFHYSPKFDCDTQQFVKEDAEDAKITCKTHFNPTPFRAKWTFTLNGKQEELNFNETSGDFKAEQFTLDEAFGEEHERHYILTIKDWDDKHLTSYRLTVENALGTNSTNILLNEGIKPPTAPPGSGSAALQWSTFTLLITTMAAIFKF